MKLKKKFSIIKNALSDIQVMHNFNYEIPTETREEFWENECHRHPNNSTCKTTGFGKKINSKGLSLSQFNLEKKFPNRIKIEP